MVHIVAFYAMPFAIALAMPGWRWLLGYALIAGALVLWAVLHLQAALSNPEHDPGIAATLSLLLFYVIGTGLASGVVTRAITLGIRVRSRPAVSICLSLAGFVALPGWYSAATWWREWRLRPPAQVCLDAKHKVELAGRTYDLPTAPIFTVVTGRGDRDDSYFFNRNPKLRALCALDQASPGPLHATALILNFDEMRRSSPRRDRPYLRDSGG